MKRSLNIILLTILLIAGCSEFLVVEPDTQVSITEQFSTEEGVLQAVNGMYHSLQSLMQGKFFLYADLVGGNFTFSPDENDQIIEVPPGRSINQVYEFRDMENESDYAAFYSEAYDLINETNLILEHVADHPLFDQAEIDQMFAEALACRAYTHYLLAVIYAQNYSYTADASHPGIIYNTRTIVAGVDYPSRSAMAETYSLMKTDLETALGLFGDRQALPYGPSYSYFNRLTTSAVYAKIALQMNDWQMAHQLSDSIITNAGISLMTGEDYVSEWEKETDPVSEIIFEITPPRTADDGSVTFSLAQIYFGYIDRDIYNEFVASGDLMDLYDSSDIRRDNYLEVLLPTSVDGTISDMPYFFTRKFQDDPGIPVSRLSEIYLIRAEAAARMGGDYSGQALADLNLLRDRAGLDPVTAGDDLLEEIFLERRRELAFENFLFFDIARYHKDIVRNKGCISAVCNMSYPSDFYVLPIPESSITLNENMVQNEGY